MAAPEPQCRFCLENGLLADEPVFANASHYFLMSIDPMLPVAGMIIPFRHSETPFTLTPTEWQDLGDMLDRAKAHFAVHEPAGYTIGWNVGAVAGQHVFHAHLHIICRFPGGHDEGVGLRRVIRKVEPTQ